MSKQALKIYAPEEATQNVLDSANRCAVLVSTTHSREMNRISMLVRVDQVSNIPEALSMTNTAFLDTGTATSLLHSKQHCWVQLLLLRSCE